MKIIKEEQRKSLLEKIEAKRTAKLARQNPPKAKLVDDKEIGIVMDHNEDYVPRGPVPGSIQEPERAIVGLLTKSQKQLMLSKSHLITSRLLNHMLDVAVLSKNFTGSLSRLTDFEEMLLDCVIDNLAKEEVVVDPKACLLLKEETLKLVRTKSTGKENYPWRVIGEDEIREKFGRHLTGREIEAGFKGLVQKAHFEGKFKAFYEPDGRFHELELLCGHLFPNMFVERTVGPTRRKGIPEESKLKRWFVHQINGPLACLVKDGQARGKFGALPQGLYQGKKSEWPAARIARYYEMYKGRRDGVKLCWDKVHELLMWDDVEDVRQRIDQIDHLYRVVADKMHAIASKAHRGRYTVWKLEDPLLIRLTRKRPEKTHWVRL
jgi:hypothetical protein